MDALTVGFRRTHLLWDLGRVVLHSKRRLTVARAITGEAMRDELNALVVEAENR